ncbi:MAG: hydrogenase maturation nickel metallochaperone HypA [Synergistaceae bacterium]|jgi:hydrogenase nickel incorporation protein HypA/HybF|nr:hydrogenase maturation nickel metallochaperone HypA [Synergistaceae bacterium]
MHEMSLVEALMEALLEAFEKHPNWLRARRVELHVGRLRQVVPEAMIFCFDVASRGTPLEGACLDLVEIPLEAFCEACGHRWGPEDLVFFCPACGSVDVETVAGMDLDIASMEVEEGDG